MADGSIVFDTRLDNSDLEKSLQSTIRKIENLKTKISMLQAERLPLVDQAQQLGIELDAAKAKLSEMQAAASGAYAPQAVADQKTQVAGLQAEWDGVQRKLDSCDYSIQKANIDLSVQEQNAGAVSEQLVETDTSSRAAGDGISAMGEAIKHADSGMRKFVTRVQGLVRRVFIFSLITMALRSLRTWFSSIIKNSDGASAAIARLKAALLTLAQPIINAVIPALIKFINILTEIITAIAKVVSFLFGTTFSASKKSAEQLSKESSAIKGVGGAAEKASKQLAAFDEINQLSDNSSSSGGGGGSSDVTSPDFAGLTESNWLEETLGKAAGWVTAGLTLAGLALIAIGAATGNLGLILAGLLLIGAGIYVGEETGVLQSWVEALGLDSVEEFVAVALILAGIAFVAIGAAMANIGLIIAGLLLIGAGIYSAEKTGVMANWADTLGLSKVAEFVTTALLLGGIALVAIGAAKASLLMILAGLGLLAAGVYVGEKSETLKKWADALGLNSVFKYVVAAVQLAGIALVAIGAAKANIALVIAGGVILAAGITADAIGEKTLKSWWDVLKLTNVQQWVSVAMTLGGIALIAIGVAMANILMVIGGMALIGVGSIPAANNGNLKDWVKVLGLEKATGWTTAALLIGGIGLVVFGIVSANILMVLAGLGLLGSGISVGVTSGTFKKWVDTILEGLKQGAASINSWWSTSIAPKLTLAYWKGQFKNIGEGLVQTVKESVNSGIALFNRFIGWVNSKLYISWNAVNILGKQIIPSGSVQLLTIPSIPYLAQGAVIPPNREFTAVLGDQSTGNNLEAPESLIRKIVREESGSGNADLLQQILQAIKDGKVLVCDKYQLGKVVQSAMASSARRSGSVSLAL